MIKESRDRIATGIVITPMSKYAPFTICSLIGDSDNYKIHERTVWGSVHNARAYLKQSNSDIIYTEGYTSAEPFYSDLQMMGLPVRKYHTTKSSKEKLYRAFYEDTRGKEDISDIHLNAMLLYQTLEGGEFTIQQNEYAAVAMALAWVGMSRRFYFRVDFA